uniref:OmpA family protein n=1 Tax=Flavobacterium sp. TaxID=239 RepID=UPI00404ADE64
MSKKVLYFLGILATLFLGTWLQSANCCSESSKTITKPTLKSTSSHKVMESENILKSFIFKKSDFNSILPVSDSITNFISELKLEIENSPNSKFEITGFYHSKEENNSIFQDLGIARANNVKNYLTSKGVSEEKILITSSLKENLSIPNDTVFGSIAISDLQIVEKLNTNWTKIKTKANAEPLTLYFKKNEASIQLSESDRDKINNLLLYLENVPNSKIIITGHTDNSGLKENNAYYSIERAKFAKNYFITNGIAEKKIITFGKGSSKPIADNGTEIGRAKNRRAELTLQ